MPESQAVAALLSGAIMSLWRGARGPHRAETLARIIHHRRQFEAWWKFELATHLWDFVGSLGDDVYVLVEDLQRADVVVATCREHDGKLFIAPNSGVRVPIELKTVGTFWGATPSAIRKAYTEPGKKRLLDDLLDCRARRRSVAPFGCVGLIVTHDGAPSATVLHDYLAAARSLGEQHSLRLLVDAAIPLPALQDLPAYAHQFLWAST